MKPGGRLKRYTRLVNKTPLRSKKKLRPAGSGGGGVPGGGVPAGGAVSEGWLSRPQARGHKLPVDVVAVVKARSGGRCEIGIEGVCVGAASQRHHRITQKAGGRHGAAARRSDRASGLLDLCFHCHDVVTNRPGRAYTYGWSLRERQDPSKEPVVRRGALVYLNDAGDVHGFETEGP